ncbi:MAG: spore germination protein GerW family protein [Pseudomonadota bacterium]
MQDVERLLKGTVEELDRLLNAKNVLGAPIERDGTTIIPLVSYGFGFGAGGGADQKQAKGEGTGGAGGIKPVGAIIIDKDGVRVEGLRGGAASLIEAIGDAAGKIAEKTKEDKSSS